VTTLFGITEVAQDNRLYNAAAVFRNGTVAGLYRKLYPAINKSVYEAGNRTPVFTVNGLTFGIVICNDSNFFEPAQIMAEKGAAILFVPTNNGLPANRTHPELVSQARNVDIARARDNRVWVVRADVSGIADGLVSDGSSAIVNPDGIVLQAAARFSETLLVADIEMEPVEARRALVMQGPGCRNYGITSSWPGWILLGSFSLSRFASKILLYSEALP
jgi:predicted amidohydrolase